MLDGLSNMLKVAASHVEEVANLIEECEGLAKIERLQSHENVEIYKLAYEIIEKYFTEVSKRNFFTSITYFNIICFQGEQSNLAPTSDGTEYNFDPNTDKLPMNSFDF